MRICLLLLIVYICFDVQSQVNFHFGQDICLGNKDKRYSYESQENPMDATISVSSDYREIGTRVFLRASNFNLADSMKFNVSYGLEFALQFSPWKTESTYLTKGPYGAYENLLLADMRTKTILRILTLTNEVVFKYRLSDKLILANGLGIKASVVNGGKSEKIGEYNSFTPLNTSTESQFINPVIYLRWSPLLLIDFGNYSIGIHLNQDLFFINEFINRRSFEYGHLTNYFFTNYTSLGVSFMPHFRNNSFEEKKDLEER